MLFERIDRIGVAVRDIDQAMRDLHDLLGCEFYGPFEDQDVGIKVALPKRMGVELVSPLREDDKIGVTQILAQAGEVATAVAWKVSDIAAAEKHMAARGLKPGVKHERCDAKELVYFPSELTHGLTIVLNEYPEENGMGLEVSKFFA